MDLGVAFKRVMTIEPVANGSFIVQVGSGPMQTGRYGFSNVSDLLDWLVANAQAFAADKLADRVTKLTEAEVEDAVEDAVEDEPASNVLRTSHAARMRASLRDFPSPGERISERLAARGPANT